MAAPIASGPRIPPLPDEKKEQRAFGCFNKLARSPRRISCSYTMKQDNEFQNFIINKIIIR